jgi:putative aldouronate transport system substrate-binding protein
MPQHLSRRDFLKTTAAGAAAVGAGLAGATPRAFAARRRQNLPKLVYIFRVQPQQDTALVQERLSEIMAERIGATIELRIIEPGVYNDQMALINAAAEEYDLVFTAPWTNNYYNNVNQEYLTPLDDLLPTLAPGLWGSMQPATWEAARVQGSIYASINQQIFVKPFGPSFRQDVIEAVGLADALAAVTRYSELTPLMAALKEYVDADDTLTHVYAAGGPFMSEIWGYDPQGNQSLGLSIKSDDASAQPVIFAETDAFREAAELTREWYMAGYVPSDILTVDEIDRGFTAGQYASRSLAGVVKPGGAAEAKARWGWDVLEKAIAEPLLTTAGTTATLTGVSSTSRNPELAVQFLELVNTDAEFYNTLCKGIEGTHWEWADKDRLLIKPAGGKASYTEVGYNPNVDWMFGNVFNSYYSSEAQVGAWPATAELNRNARPSPVLGFTFDPKPVETEVASLSAVQAEFVEPLTWGLVDPAQGLPALIQAQRAAGIERVQEEMARQIEAWRASQA